MLIRAIFIVAGCVALSSCMTTRPALVMGRDAAAIFATLERDHPAPYEASGRLAMMAQAKMANKATDLARLVAMVGDGHTFLPLLDLPFDGMGKGPSSKQLPLRFEWFDDGLFIVGASSEHAGLIGEKIDAIGSVPVDRLLGGARRFLPVATPRFADEYAPETLLADIVLQDLGASDGLTAQIDFASGRSKTVQLVHPSTRFDWIISRNGGMVRDWANRPEPATRGAYGLLFPHPQIAWWRMSELRPSGDDWNEELDLLFSEIEASRATRVVLDIRDCVGGDGTLIPLLMEHLVKAPSPVALIGRRTHSACVMLTGALEAAGIPLLGQPTGDSPVHIGETNLEHLPESGWPWIHASERYVTTREGDARPWFEPETLLPFRSGDYLAARDPAFEYLKRITE